MTENATNARPQNDFDLAVTIPTFNSMRTIGRTLDSVKSIARRIIVVDSGSIDGTIDRCKDYGAEVIDHAWEGMVRQRQFTLDQCASHDWILSLDSDESIEPELRDSIIRALSQDNDRYSAFYLNRKVWFLGGWLNYTFQPEWRLRLVRGGQARVTSDGGDNGSHHDHIVVDGRCLRLQGDCRHDSWADLSHMARKHLSFAEAARARRSGGTLANILINPPAAFCKQYMLKRGFLDGWRGMVAAGAVASYTLLKHMFIAVERNRQPEDRQ